MAGMTADPIVDQRDDETTLRAAVASDFRRSTWLQRLVLVAVVFWIGYEWGAGNETFTPWLLVTVINNTDGWRSVVAVGAVGFAFTAAQQLVSGFTTAAGFSMFPRTARVSWRRLSAHHGAGALTWSNMGWGSRAVLVFSLGTTAVVSIQVALTSDVGARAHRRAVVQSACLVAGLVAAIGMVIAAMAMAGRNSPRFATATDWSLRILGNPLVWIALVVVMIAAQLWRHRAETAAGA